MLNSLCKPLSRLPFACLTLTLLLWAQYVKADWLDDYAKHVQREAVKYNVPGYAFVFMNRAKYLVFIFTVKREKIKARK